VRRRQDPVVEAAGALVWRLRQGQLQVALVHRPRYRDWSWPKGKLEPREPLLAAATREVAEEAGRPVVLGVPLPTLRYALADGRRKRVRYWAARLADDGDAHALRARPPVGRASREEIDQVRWYDVEAADRRLTRPTDREPLRALVDAYAKGRLDTRALVVVRHGSARKRADWPGTEADRPLTPTGLRQSRALIPVLSAFGVGEVLTSEWLRCRATVEPYAVGARIEPTLVPTLTEDAHAASPGRVAAQVVELLESGRDAALCTHRPVLTTVVDVLAQHARRSVADGLPRSDPFLRPGQVLVAHVTRTEVGPRVVATEQHPGRTRAT